MSELNVTVEATIPVAAKSKVRKPKAAKPIDLREVELRVQRLIAAKAKAKALYAECDQLESELRNLIGEQSVTLSTGDVVEIVDNFADGNIVWAHAAARRFESTVNGKKVGDRYFKAKIGE